MLTKAFTGEGQFWSFGHNDVGCGVDCPGGGAWWGLFQSHPLPPVVMETEDLCFSPGVACARFLSAGSLDKFLLLFVSGTF